MTTVNIGTAEELQNFATRVNAGETTLDAVLTADIDLTGVTWTPIGTSTYPYTGTFDGNGKTVSNISDKFTIIDDNCIIQNVRFTKLTTSIIGSTIAETESSKCAEFKNCMIDNSTFTLTQNGIFGGILSDVNNCIIDNCTVNLTVTTGYGKGGALFREYWWNGQGYIKNLLVNNCKQHVNYTQSVQPSTAFLVGCGQYINISSVAMLNTQLTSNKSTYGLFSDTTPRSLLYHDNLSSIGGTCPTSTDTTSKNGALTSDLNTQSFYENTLVWDFNNTWYWDSTANLPKLQIFKPIPSVNISNGTTWSNGTPYVYDTEWLQGEKLHVYTSSGWTEKV